MTMRPAHCWWATWIGFLMLGCAEAPSPKDASAAEELPGHGAVEVHGALRAMFHEGQTGPVVVLDTLLPDPDLYAVGALADLAGEVTVVGGEAYLSYPEGEDSTRTETSTESGEAATLLVAAAVSEWQSIVIQEAIPFNDLDERIAELAAAAGQSVHQRFPFLVEGELVELQWHVIDGSRLTGEETSHRDHLAAAVQEKRERAAGVLVGFYSQTDQGVFTHMGSRTHLHCVLDDPLFSGHVDHVVIPKGAILKLPAVAR